MEDASVAYSVRWLTVLCVLSAIVLNGCSSDEPPTTTTDPGIPSISVRKLAVGDCFDLGMTTDAVYSQPCDGSHDGEVTARPEQAAGNYPGAKVLQSQIDAACHDSLGGDVQARLTDEQLALQVVIPNPVDWASGDRSGICLVSRGTHEAPLEGRL